VRTFCVAPYGEVVTEWAAKVMTVNGHSYAHQKPITRTLQSWSVELYRAVQRADSLRKIHRPAANLLSGGNSLLHALETCAAGRRTTDPAPGRCFITRPTLKNATPGDLGLVLPYRYVVDV